MEIVKERVSEITWLPAEKIRESARMYAMLPINRLDKAVVMYGFKKQPHV